MVARIDTGLGDNGKTKGKSKSPQKADRQTEYDSSMDSIILDLEKGNTKPLAGKAHSSSLKRVLTVKELKSANPLLKQNSSGKKNSDLPYIEGTPEALVRKASIKRGPNLVNKDID